MRVKRTIFKATLIVLTLVLLTTCFQFTVSAEDNTVYVKSSYKGTSDGSAEKPYKTIEEAINNVDSGGTIYVFGGLYREYLVIDKTVKIVGGIDEVESVIDISYDRRYLVEITVDEVTIEGITFSDEGGSMTSPIGALLAINSDNNRIVGNVFNHTNTYGIYIGSSADDNLVSNNIINDTKVGMYIASSSTNDLANNEIYNSTEYGIYMKSSGGNNRLYGNLFENTPTGIYIDSSSKVNITYNDFEDIDNYGIYVVECTDGLITNNLVSNSSGDAMLLNSEDFFVRNNTMINCVRGINIWGSNNIVENNTFRNLSASGIYARSGSRNNVIYLNRFKNNGVSAKDLGDNRWYFNSSGNYWSDYNNIDKDEDGLGDVFYSKNGVIDRYPLGYFLKPPDRVTEPSPADKEKDVGLTVSIAITVTDPDSDFLDVYFYKADDDTLIESVTPNPKNHVYNNTQVRCNFTLAFNRTFAWYVIVDDGLLQNKSDVFFFITTGTPPNNKPPVAISGGPYYGEAEIPVVFDASECYDPDGEIDFYRWNFGDGSSEIIDIKPEHIFDMDGEYTITLTVIDNNGSSSTDTHIAFIGPKINDPPSVKSTFVPTGIAGQSIFFSSIGSNDPDMDELSYSWDFGDGSKSTDENPVHTYESAGKYFVTLKVSDGEFSNTTVSEITIEPSSTGIPGFELFLTIFAIMVAFVIVKKRK